MTFGGVTKRLVIDNLESRGRSELIGTIHELHPKLLSFAAALRYSVRTD